MLQLGRLDENMREKAKNMGVENLEAEMNTIIPHLASSAATLEAATALKENKMDKAADELNITALHLFTFNSIESTAAWQRKSLA